VEACFFHQFSLVEEIMDVALVAEVVADSISVDLVEATLVEAVPAEIFKKSVSLRKK
jgi:hypothetical protein